MYECNVQYINIRKREGTFKFRFFVFKHYIDHLHKRTCIGYAV